MTGSILDEKVIMASETIVDFEKRSEDQQTVVGRDSDSVRKEALGDDLPKGYFYSVGFLGALAVSGLASFALFSMLMRILRASVSRPYPLISFYFSQLTF